MNKKVFMKIFTSLMSSVVMINSTLCFNSFAVETNRSWRYGMGDVLEDNDRQSANDLNTLKKYVLTMIDLSDTQLKSADVKIDFNVNAADLLFMKKDILGICGYDDESIDDMQVAISNSDNPILMNMRDVIGEFMYEYHKKGWKYWDASTSEENDDDEVFGRKYIINGESYSGCRTDCSTAVSLTLLYSGILDKDELNNNGLSAYLSTSELINKFSIIQNCVNEGYKLSLIDLVPNVTYIQPGDILLYSGHTSVVISTTQFDLIPTNLSGGISDNVAVYSAGGDFTAVHNHRLMPERETIDLNSSGNTQGIRPYRYIIRVSRV